MAPIVIGLCAITMCGLLVLVAYHYKLTSNNQMTYEQVRMTYAFYRRSPFRDYGTVKNIRHRFGDNLPKYPVLRPRKLVNAKSYKPPIKTTPIMPTEASNNIFDDQSNL